MEQSQGEAMNLIKEANKQRGKGNISEGLSILEQALNDPHLNKEFDEHIKIELENKRLDSKAELLKWDEIANELNLQYKQNQLGDIHFH